MHFFPFPTSLDLNIWWSKNGRIWNSCHIGRKYRSCQRNKSKTNSRGIPKVNEKKTYLFDTYCLIYRSSTWGKKSSRFSTEFLVRRTMCSLRALLSKCVPNCSKVKELSLRANAHFGRGLYSTSAALRLLLWRVCSYNSATGFSFLSWEFSGASYFHF